MQTIPDILAARWQPTAILVYGSFADGTQDEFSDFDALVITDRPAPIHDHSLLEGRQLDVFFAAPSLFEGEWFPEDFEQLYHAVPVLDETGLGARIIAEVRRWFDTRPPMTPEVKAQQLAWCRKMLRRAAKGDPEGLYRLHWLLTESLRIWCEVTDRNFFGSKKTLRLMREVSPEAFDAYTKALADPTPTLTERWIGMLCRDAVIPET